MSLNIFPRKQALAGYRDQEWQYAIPYFKFGPVLMNRVGGPLRYYTLTGKRKTFQLRKNENGNPHWYYNRNDFLIDFPANLRTLRANYPGMVRRTNNNTVNRYLARENARKKQKNTMWKIVTNIKSGKKLNKYNIHNLAATVRTFATLNGPWVGQKNGKFYNNKGYPQSKQNIINTLQSNVRNHKSSYNRNNYFKFYNEPNTYKYFLRA